MITFEKSCSAGSALQRLGTESTTIDQDNANAATITESLRRNVREDNRKLIKRPAVSRICLQKALFQDARLLFWTKTRETRSNTHTHTKDAYAHKSVAQSNSFRESMDPKILPVPATRSPAQRRRALLSRHEKQQTRSACLSGQESQDAVLRTRGRQATWTNRRRRLTSSPRKMRREGRTRTLS